MKTHKNDLNDRGLPASLSAERTILGAFMVDPGTVHMLDRIDARDFSIDSHQRIFNAILSLAKKARKIDLITLIEEIKSRNELEAVGDRPYIFALTEDLPRHLHIDEYIHIVKQKSMMRQVMMLGQDLYQGGADASLNPEEFIERSIAYLQSIREDSSDSELMPVGKYMDSKGVPESILERMESKQGVRLGFGQWDAMVGGAQPKDLIIVAARPSMGKTAWACNAAHHIAVRAGKTVAFFTLEQSRDLIIRRMLAAAGRIDAMDIRKGTLRREDREVLLEQRDILAASHLYLEDRPRLTVSRIKAKCLRLKNQVGLDIVFIDQLSKVHNGDVYQRGMPKHEWVGAQTYALKLMAQELDVPVVLFNQLGRETAKRSDPTPQLQDLKESGNIEEDADVVTFLHRPEYYDRKDESLKGKGQMIVAKNREGDTGTIDCTYQGRILRWEDVAEREAEQQAMDSYNARW